MEGEGCAVGSLDDGHAFELDYWYCVSYLINAEGVFSLTYGRELIDGNSGVGGSQGGG